MPEFVDRRRDAAPSLYDFKPPEQASWRPKRRSCRALTEMAPLETPLSYAGHIFLIGEEVARRDGVAELLSFMELQIHAWADATQFLAENTRAVPAVIVAHLRDTGMTGIALQAELIRRGITVPVVFMASEESISDAVRAMKQGAIDVLVEPVSREKLLQAVSTALERDLGQMRELVRKSRLSAKNSQLSPRESQVHQLMVKGFGNREISESLAISVPTVKQYKSTVMRKFGVRTLAELIAASAAEGK